MIQCSGMGKDTAQLLQLFAKKGVILSVSHRNATNNTIINDTTIPVTINHIESTETAIVFHLSQTNTEHTLTTLHIPHTAVVSVQNGAASITYNKGTQHIIISLKPQYTEINQSTSLPQKPDFPYVKEFKDNTGTVKKIVIHIPSDSVDQLLLSTANSVVNELLREWRIVSVAKRMGGQLTWQYQKLQVKEVTLVYLPGDSFMQVQAFDQKEQITIDLPFDLFINLASHTISFTFDDIHYELVKTARENI